MKGWEGGINPVEDKGNEKAGGQRPRRGNVAMAPWGGRAHSVGTKQQAKGFSVWGLSITGVSFQ